MPRARVGSRCHVAATRDCERMYEQSVRLRALSSYFRPRCGRWCGRTCKRDVLSMRCGHWDSTPAVTLSQLAQLAAQDADRRSNEMRPTRYNSIHTYAAFEPRSEHTNALRQHDEAGTLRVGDCRALRTLRASGGRRALDRFTMYQQERPFLAPPHLQILE